MIYYREPEKQEQSHLSYEEQTSAYYAQVDQINLFPGNERDKNLAELTAEIFTDPDFKDLVEKGLPNF